MNRRASPSPTPATHRWTLRFALLGGGAAWLMHLLLCYVIAEFGLLSGLDQRVWVGGLDAVSWLLLVCTAVMLIIAGAAIEVARRVPGRTLAGDESRRTAAFCSRFGVAANVAFIAIIAAQTIPILFYLRR